MNLEDTRTKPMRWWTLKQISDSKWPPTDHAIRQWIRRYATDVDAQKLNTIKNAWVVSEFGIKRMTEQYGKEHVDSLLKDTPYYAKFRANNPPTFM